MSSKKKSKPKKNRYPTFEEVAAINKYITTGEGEIPPEQKATIDKMNAKLVPRDPKRIPVILEELRKLWEKVPDQRLGQLLGNYVFDDGNRDKRSFLFYQDDPETLEALKATNESMEKQKKEALENDE